MLLAIDTATNYLNLALHDGTTLLAEQSWHVGKQHNALLAESVQHMLHVCDVTSQEITVLAVATGPGSYSGLRIGVALAKGLAAARSLPLVGVSTLDTLAVGQPFQNTRYRLLAVIQAGRKRIISGEYRVKKGRWERSGDVQHGTWAELLHEREGSYYITGEIDLTGQEAIEQARHNGASLTVVSPAHRARRAGFLAQEAWRRYHEGEADSFHPARLTPFYINKP